MTNIWLEVQTAREVVDHHRVRLATWGLERFRRWCSSMGITMGLWLVAHHTGSGGQFESP